MLRFICSGLLVLAVAGCGSMGAGTDKTAAPPALADPNATEETRALFATLRALADDHVLFGHHDDLAYGVSWSGEEGRSDVKEASGSYPALYGYDVSRLFRGRGSDAERRAELRKWMIEGFKRGGVLTLCWHMSNPVTNGSFYDTTRAVHAILPGASHHDAYREKLDDLADFLKSLRTGFWAPFGGGTRVPVIFRPFHEHTGSWFWWGERHSTREDFIDLWRFTVEYLRDEKGVRNLLYSYSTDVFDSKEEYLDRYPGDAYIDVLGFDDYHSVSSVERQDEFVRRLRMLVEMADERGKIAALTETGVETIPDSTWWTQVLLDGIKADPAGRRIAYLMVWRNAIDRPDHYYAPYPGHPSVPDFIRFRDDPFVLFEEELPDLYD